MPENKTIASFFENMIHYVQPQIIEECDKTAECLTHGPYSVHYIKYDDGNEKVTPKFCPKCEEERERERKMREEEDARIELLKEYRSRNISPEFFDKGFEDFIAKTKGQQAALDAVKELVSSRKGKLILIGTNGAGKEEWVEQKIPTPLGFRRFGDLKVGDYVYDETGKPTKVLGVYPQGMKDSYKITFKDGRSDECGLEHLWGVYTKNHGKWKYQILSLKEMLQKGMYHPNGYSKYYIPASPVIECEDKKLPCDPYILGSFIGNGCCTSTYLCLSSNDEWQVKKCADILGCTLQRDTANFNWYFKNGQKLRTDKVLPEDVRCYAREKHIPDEYIFASSKQRLALLQGLFDTDGAACACGKRLNIRYSTVSKRLAYDIKTLLLTFGIVSSIHEDNRKKRTCYEIAVNCSVDKARLLFSLPRKLEKVNNPNVTKGSHRDYTKVRIKSVEKLPEKKEMMCIWVENESHLYLTKDFLVTHNTMLGNIAVKIMGGKIYTMYEIATRIRQSYAAGATETELEILNELINEPLLVIDEVGRLKMSESVQDWFSFILDKRHTYNKPFFLIGNLHFNKDCDKKKEGGCQKCFENYFDKDILSRLTQNSVIIEIIADDNRREEHSCKFITDRR